MNKTMCLLLITVVWLFQAGYAVDNTATSNQGSKKIILADKDLGSKTNPVKCDKTKGEEVYLEKLRDMNGKPVLYERIGHACSAAGHVLDQYEIKSNDGRRITVIYMNMYCPGHNETQPVKGFQMNTTSTASPKTTTQPKNSSPKKPTVNPEKQNPTTKTKTSVQNEKTDPSSKTNSSQRKNTRQFSDEKIPGFDDIPDPPGQKQPASNKQKNTAAPMKKPAGNQIPGFDDVPDKSQSSHSAPVGNEHQATQTYLSIIPIPHKIQEKKTPGNQFPEIINQGFTDTFDWLKKSSTVPLLINQKGHTIQDQKQTKIFHSICASQDDKSKKLKTLTQKILEPGKIDFIAAGTWNYNKKNKEYTLNPILVGKLDQKLLMPETFVYGSEIKPDAVKKDFKEKILKLIQAEFPSMISNQSPNPSLVEIYAALIPLSPPADNTKTEPKSLPELLNSVVAGGINIISPKYPHLVVNENTHTINDSGTGIDNLNRILLDSNLNDNRKAEKIINEIMIPNGVDLVFTLHYTEDNPNNIVFIRPYVIGKSQKKMFSMNLIFQKEELVCNQPKSKLPMICRTAEDNIANAVRTLLEQAMN